MVYDLLTTRPWAIQAELAAGPMLISAAGRHSAPLKNREQSAWSVASILGMGATVRFSPVWSLRGAVSGMAVLPAVSVGMLDKREDLGQPMWALRLGPEGRF
jgi:predicted membrane-bound mannosyltransferase